MWNGTTHGIGETNREIFRVFRVFRGLKFKGLHGHNARQARNLQLSTCNLQPPRLGVPTLFNYSGFMPEPKLHILAVVGSLHRQSVTRTVIQQVARQLRDAGCSVDVLDFEKEPLALYNPDTAPESPGYAGLQGRVERADVVVLGTPDYHGGISGAMKNFLDHFWHEFAGKLFATIVASHEKGLTVTDQLRTVARQCYAWTLPYGVALSEDDDVQDGQVVTAAAKERLAMLVRDVRVYGDLLARQRRADLAATDPGFLGRLKE